MNAGKTNLLGLTGRELCTFVEGIGGSRYRGRQIFRWLYGRGIREFHAMTDLAREFRGSLESFATIEGLVVTAEQRSSKDGTTKYLFELGDGLKVESVLIPPASAFSGREASHEDEQRRLTLCVSTQVGCPLDCAFCATATMGFRRNLTAGEIVDQVLRVRKVAGRKITNIVFMGMGEPLMNYDNVIKSTEIISEGLGISLRRMTVSTAGWAEKIRQMADEGRKIKLAVSLHSAIEATRVKLMPVTRRFGLHDLAGAISYYYKLTKQRITYEQIFFDGINDSEREIAHLVKFARLVPCKINVIPFHSIAFTAPVGVAASLRPSLRTAEIVDHLRESHLSVFMRSSSGEDIDAACGQLAVKTDRSKKRRGFGADWDIRMAVQ